MQHDACERDESREKGQTVGKQCNEGKDQMNLRMVHSSFDDYKHEEVREKEREKKRQEQFGMLCLSVRFVWPVAT